MALVTCEKCGPPKGSKRQYGPVPVLPVNHPNSGVVCGRVGCTNPGVVWLDQSDAAEYKKGERVIPVPNSGVKLRVQ